MAYFNFFQRRSAQKPIMGNFNFKPPTPRYWPTIFFLLGAGVFLFFLIWVLSPSLKPQWREIKNSTQTATILLSASDQKSYAQAGFGGTIQTVKPAESINSVKPAESINFLLLGASGEGYEAPDLTDTILVARLITAQNKIYLFSLPRDLWVKIPGQENWTKLNALYALAKKNKGHEFDLIKKKVQDITGLAINHYVLVNLDTVKDLVDTLGGVNVMVKKDIYDNTFPGPNHTYQVFEIKAGWRYLDGATALKYIRSRHSSAGDFDRIARQQEVLQALKQKVLSLNFWDLPTYWSIFNTISSKIKTDLNIWQIKDFWDKIKDIPGQNVVKTEINTADLVTTGQANLGEQIASIVQPRAGQENYEEIRNYIEKIINN